MRLCRMLGRTQSVERDRARLGERRRNRRRRILIASLILLLLLLTVIIYGLQQNAIRVSSINVNDSDSLLSAYAEDAIKGNYFGIIPRNSVFFFPEERIRADILATHSDIAAVSI